MQVSKTVKNGFIPLIFCIGKQIFIFPLISEDDIIIRLLAHFSLRQFVGANRVWQKCDSKCQKESKKLNGVEKVAKFGPLRKSEFSASESNNNHFLEIVSNW